MVNTVLGREEILEKACFFFSTVKLFSYRLIAVRWMNIAPFKSKFLLCILDGLLSNES